MKGRPRHPAGKQAKRKQKPPVSPKKFYKHPLYGDVPLIAQTLQDASGREHTIYMWDLNYEPPMPRSAVRGDVRKQNLCLACHTPKYFYIDEQRTCIQCGKDFVFSAAEQKFWYESLGFYGTSVAIRCVTCRRKKRDQNSLNQQIALAKTGLKKSPRDPALLLELAEAIILYRMATGNGKLEEAISAARLARQIDVHAIKGIFWEGCAHMIAGRAEKAKKLLSEYLSSSANSTQQAALKTKASEYLEQLQGSV